MSEKASLRQLGVVKRKTVTVTEQSLVTAAPFLPGSKLPLLVQPNVGGVNLNSWAEGHREWVERQLDEFGGILFRGFDVRTPDAFEGFIRAVSGETLEYRERSSPRSQVSGNIYTSTDYPPDQTIFLHNENSYQQAWPLRIFFCCLKAAEKGGETPIADTRRIFQKIDSAIRARFAERGWMYVRNFGDGFGLPWQTVFQSSDPGVVEAHCRKSGIQYEWRPEGRLRLRSVRPAIATHPRTGEKIWFNHATFFHVTTLSPSMRDVLLENLAEEDLPTNTYYGDGTPIEPSVLDELRAIYNEETVRFPWQVGDVLVLDNMLAAHGRAPFVGERKVVVGMAKPTTWQDIPQ